MKMYPWNPRDSCHLPDQAGARHRVDFDWQFDWILRSKRQGRTSSNSAEFVAVYYVYIWVFLTVSR